MQGECRECGRDTVYVATDGYYFLCQRHGGTSLVSASAIPEGLITERELQVACFLADGYGNKEIATELDLSVGYVSNVVSRLMVDLNVTDRHRVAAVLRRWNLP